MVQQKHDFRDSPFHFEWPVDRHGYEPVPVPAQGGSLLESYPAHDVIRPLGGPLEFYRPMEEAPDLWRRFATCSDTESALAFVRQFGLLVGSGDEWVSKILDDAAALREISAAIDQGDMPLAASLFGAPRLTAQIIANEQGDGFLFKIVPFTLLGALLLQAGQAITRNERWQPCRNERCDRWFRIGARIGRRKVSRSREFCSDRCRVAWARHHKHKEEERHA